MSIAIISLWVKIGLCVTLSALLARRLRAPVRKIFTRMVPMKDRMAENFLSRLAKVSMGVGIAITLLLSGMSYWWLNTVWPTAWSKKKTLQSLESAPLPPAPRTPIEQETPFSLVIEQPEPLPPVPTQPDPLPRSKTAQRVPSTSLQLKWFIQVNAFEAAEHAFQHYDDWRSQTKLNVYVAVDEGAMIPWKVLIGPFSNRKAARAHRNRHQIDGFPRSAIGLTFRSR